MGRDNEWSIYWTPTDLLERLGIEGVDVLPLFMDEVSKLPCSIHELSSSTIIVLIKTTIKRLLRRGRPWDSGLVRNHRVEVGTGG